MKLLQNKKYVPDLYISESFVFIQNWLVTVTANDTENLLCDIEPLVVQILACETACY